MTRQQWQQAWQQTMSKHRLGFVAFQDAVMMGRIKLKWVRRSKGANENRLH